VETSKLICAYQEEVDMHYSDYLREQATTYRQLGEAADDPVIKEDFFDSAMICEEVADNIDYRRASG
jgi:hypothetical protein